MRRESQLARMSGKSAALAVCWCNFSHSMCSTYRMAEMQRDEIRKHVEKLGITSLYHFTRIENVPSIMEHGVLSLGEIGKRKIHAVTNDVRRFDGRVEGVSVSVSFPNYKMFAKYRYDLPEVKWTVLEIDPRVLWEKDCAFFKHNAADGRVNDIPLHFLKGLAAFRRMFSGEQVHLASESGDIRAIFDPVDVQAEVMVFDVIEPWMIKKAYFNDKAAMLSCLPHLLDGVAVFVGNGASVFSSRAYFRRHEMDDSVVVS